MKIAAIICVVVAVISCSFGTTTSVKFQFEDVELTTEQQIAFLRERTNADMGDTFALVDESGYSKRFSFWLCLEPETASTTVDVQFKIRYSNEADMDTIRVVIGGTLVYEIDTIETGGWNAFSLSAISSINAIPAGTHKVKVFAYTGAAGVELDVLEVILTNQNPNSPPADCKQSKYHE